MSYQPIKPFQKKKIPSNSRILIVTDMNYHNALYRMEFLLDENKNLVDIFCQPKDNALRVGDLYIARIDSVIRHPNAAFLSLCDLDGETQRGYLRVKDKMPLFYTDKPSKKDFYQGQGLCQGDSLLVMIEKAAVRSKEPVLTTQFTMESNHLIYTYGRCGLHFPKSFRKREKQELTDLIQSNSMLPKTGSIAFRSNGKGMDTADLYAEYQTFLRSIEESLENYSHKKGPMLIKKAKAHYLDRLLHNQEEFDYIRTDLEDVYHEFVEMAHEIKFDLEKIDYYTDNFPISNLYSLTSKLDEALHTTVYLRSGASLVIEKTEAMYVIDINSGKSSKLTPFQINMEACKELARQIRIRNLSGIIVIDFLKMKDLRENETIVKEMSRLSQLDPTPTKVYGLTRLGLMEMTRNKEYATLKEQLTL